MAYEKQLWVNNESPVDADRMNHIENGIASADEILANFNLYQSINLLDTSKIIAGYIDMLGNYVTSEWYSVSDFIPVEEGQTITFQYNGNIDSSGMRFVTAYDQNKQCIQTAGSNESTNEYEVPEGVKYVRISAYSQRYALSSSPMIFNGTEVQTYVPYYRYYKLKKDSLSSDVLETLDNADKVFECFEIVKSKNLFDISAMTSNTIIPASGVPSATNDYDVTDYIPVTPGQTIKYEAGGSLRTMRMICAYGTNKNVIPSAGNNDGTNTYVVPADVYFIRASIYKPVLEYTNQIIYVDGTIEGFVPYFDPYYVLKEDNMNKEAIMEIVEENLVVSIDQVTFAEWDNYFDYTTALDHHYAYDNYVVENNDYYCSDYIMVEPNTDYAFARNSQYPGARFVVQFDKYKNSLGTVTSVNTIRTGATTRYIKVTFYGGVAESTACVVKGTVPASGLPHKKLIPSTYIKDVPTVTAFLPKEICCVVGTTIEIYNDQVLPCADKYHFQWTCNVGKPLNRKFSVTGTNSNKGTYTLTLNIYNDDMSVVASASSTLKIIDAVATTKSICPIGDSLTNGKYWLECVNSILSNNNIQYVGTRGSVTGRKHEGRSGWTAGMYLSDTQYTYETPATPNPFWDPSASKFSWSYYKSTYSINPDAVQIWLGTNDLLGSSASQFVTNIKSMIQGIRDVDASIPIFICLTILPAEQNGIGAQTSSDGFQSSVGRWQYDWWDTIINGVKLLEDELIALNDSHLHIIPLVCSHDSKYNFGVVETPVNPHVTTVTEPMPVEGVHPQQPGYEQVADIMFGCYSAHL